MAKNPYSILEFKATNIVLYKYVKLVLLIHEDLMHQLQLCMATGSRQNMFAEAPVTFRTYAQYWSGKFLFFLSFFLFYFSIHPCLSFSLTLLSLVSTQMGDIE